MVVFTISLPPLKAGLLSVTYAETPPALVSVDPTAIMAGASLTVKGSNFGNVATWKAVVELANGEKFEQPVRDVTATQFKITVPNIYSMYQGYKDASKNAEIRKRMQMGKAIYVKKGTMVSNKLAFNIIWPSPWIDGLFFKAPAHPGDDIIVNGGNWDPKLIFAPNMFWGVFEYQPGKSIKTNLFPPVAQMPLLALFPFLPNTTAVGSFSVKVPDVFAGKLKAEREAIASSTGKFYIYGLLGPNFASNSLSLQIKMKPVNIPNPYRLSLAAYYAPNAPNRTMFYKGNSNIVLPYSEKATITNVKNTSKYPINLTMKDVFGKTVGGPVSLGPTATTGAFNGKDANAHWEALGPESGSFLKQYPSIGIEISWKQ